MTHALQQVANKHCGGKLLLALEGGYNLECLARCSLACIEVLVDQLSVALVGCQVRLNSLSVRRLQCAAYWQSRFASIEPSAASDIARRNCVATLRAVKPHWPKLVSSLKVS